MMNMRDKSDKLQDLLLRVKGWLSRQVARTGAKKALGYFTKTPVVMLLLAYLVFDAAVSFYSVGLAVPLLVVLVGAVFTVFLLEAVATARTEESVQSTTVRLSELISLYYQRRSEAIMKETWPYDIDESTLVKNFYFRYGGVLSQNRQLETSEDCLSFIARHGLNPPVVCIGNYGMGKSTLSKIFFKSLGVSEDRDPVYISLRHKSVKDLVKDRLAPAVVEEVAQYLPNGKHPKAPDQVTLTKGIEDLLDSGRLVLVLDGLDEAVLDADDLLEFVQEILRSKVPIFLTCRNEYRPFFDTCSALNVGDDSFLCIELSEWGKCQWETYADGLNSKYPSKGQSILGFHLKVLGGVYGTLPSRPLFLKMLSDLEINNETEIVIQESLSSNLAEVYYKFLKWKITDDYKKRSGVGKLDLEVFQEESFRLMEEVAILEYTSDGPVTLEAIMDICSREKFIQLTKEYTKDILLRSSLFALLSRTELKSSFSFSHKSFMEYLVAYKLAKCISPENAGAFEAQCDATWKNFQTREVSHHFLNELERIRVTRNLTLAQMKVPISYAFRQAIAMDIGFPYSERLQQVLYYVGTLHVDSRELRELLLSVINNRKIYDPRYYRAASISLSRILGPQYCEDYVLGLLQDPTGPDFSLNRNIQLKYYGESSLRKTLKGEIDDFLRGTNQDSIISLKIMTYFTAPHSKKEDTGPLTTYLQEVRAAAASQGCWMIVSICDKTADLLRNRLDAA